MLVLQALSGKTINASHEAQYSNNPMIYKRAYPRHQESKQEQNDPGTAFGIDQPAWDIALEYIRLVSSGQERRKRTIPGNNRKQQQKTIDKVFFIG